MQRLCQNWKEFRIEENHSSPESPFRGTVLLFSARTRKEQHPSYPPNLPQTPASVGPGTFSRLSHDTKNTDTASLKKFTPYPLSGFRAGGEGAEAEKLRKASTIFVFNYENESHIYYFPCSISDWIPGFCAFLLLILSAPAIKHKAEPPKLSCSGEGQTQQREQPLSFRLVYPNLPSMPCLSTLGWLQRST